MYTRDDVPLNIICKGTLRLKIESSTNLVLTLPERNRDREGENKSLGVYLKSREIALDFVVSVLLQSWLSSGYQCTVLRWLNKPKSSVGWLACYFVWHRGLCFTFHTLSLQGRKETLWNSLKVKGFDKEASNITVVSVRDVVVVVDFGYWYQWTKMSSTG